MKISQICLDMDGVLCDFVTPVVKLFAPDSYDLVIQGWERGCYSIEKVLGVSTRELWKRIDAEGFSLWANLEPYDWHRELLQLCQETAPTVICTSPSLKAASLKGKICWLQRMYGMKFRDYLIGPPKHFCARPGAVLIDDFDNNCERFREAGGLSITFPRVWNSHHHVADDPLLRVRDLLQAYAGKSEAVA